MFLIARQNFVLPQFSKPAYRAARTCRTTASSNLRLLRLVIVECHSLFHSRSSLSSLWIEDADRTFYLKKRRERCGARCVNSTSNRRYFFPGTTPMKYSRDSRCRIATTRRTSTRWARVSPERRRIRAIKSDLCNWFRRFQPSVRTPTIVVSSGVSKWHRTASLQLSQFRWNRTERHDTLVQIGRSLFVDHNDKFHNLFVFSSTSRYFSRRRTLFIWTRRRKARGRRARDEPVRWTFLVKL